MNGWDIFTWLCSVGLVAAAVAIFGFFLRDARSILDREMRNRDREPQSQVDSTAAIAGPPNGSES